ncbi:unnamed protein product [Lactuca saligna]|uniref:PATROL1-like C-terminal domain-containing protein n=1 Tax=Lactuca saligna TaxID=75948 RepID=A0AA35V491_LACSI|nr:unnamed protein product [Lactuca saligna]
MIYLDPEKESNEGEDVVVFLCLIDFSPFATTHSSHQKLCCPHRLLYQIPITPPSSIHYFSSSSATVLLYRCFLNVPVTNTGGRRRRWIGGTIPSAYTVSNSLRWPRTSYQIDSYPIGVRKRSKRFPDRKSARSQDSSKSGNGIEHERAIQQEKWEPVLMQQRHGSSIVEVYRIIAETVDQFFALKIPMRSGEMNSLF